MNGLLVQERLKAAGYDPGPIDGDVGPKTYRALIDYALGRVAGERSVLFGRAFTPLFDVHDVDTPLRIAHFLAQVLHESGGFRYMEELGGPAYFKRYDWRVDLGNIKPGDGARYHGRGAIQLTGRANYRKFGKRIGIDLEAHPERAAEPAVSAAIACLYWSDKGLNTYADRDDLRTITKKINGGYNGLEDRERYLNKLKRVLVE